MSVALHGASVAGKPQNGIRDVRTPKTLINMHEKLSSRFPMVWSWAGQELWSDHEIPAEDATCPLYRPCESVMYA